METTLFFRDLNHEENLENGLTFHAAGIIDYISPNKGNGSGKDYSVIYIHPFDFFVVRAWRSENEIEIFEVDDYTYQSAKESLDDLESE
jgi:hypothetical protein